MHDHAASVVSLARGLLLEIPPEGETVAVRSASLRLVIDTFIEMASARPPVVPRALLSAPTPQHRGDAQRRTIAEHLARAEDVGSQMRDIREQGLRADEDRLGVAERFRGGLGLPGDEPDRA